MWWEMAVDWWERQREGGGGSGGRLCGRRLLQPPGSGVWLKASGSGRTTGMLTCCSTSLMPAERAADGGTPMRAIAVSGSGTLGSAAALGSAADPAASGAALGLSATPASPAVSSERGFFASGSGLLASTPSATGRPRETSGALPRRELKAHAGILLDVGTPTAGAGGKRRATAKASARNSPSTASNAVCEKPLQRPATRASTLCTPPPCRQ